MSIDPNQLKYLQNLAAGKTSKGGQANAGQIAWANSQLKNAGSTGMSASTAKTTTTSKTTGSFPPSVMNAATNASGSTPALGYGSGGTYGSTPGLGAAYSANKALISTPEGRQSEIDRTLGVIANRQAAGLDTTEQTNYLTRNLGYSAQQAQGLGSMPRDAVTNVRSSSDLQQLAQDQTAMERAALLNAINTQMGNIRNNAEYANQLLTDNRVLQDQQFNRTNNPFSGGSDYRAAMVQRGRDIDDKSRADSLTNSLNSLQQEIANFDKLTPERQRSIYNELLQLERDFGLNLGQLTGNYGGQRTLAGQQLDRGIYESDRDYNYQVGRDQVSDNQWQQQFEEDRRRYGEQFAYQQARDKIADAQDKRDFDERVRQAGLDSAVQWYNAKTSRMQQDRLSSAPPSSSSDSNKKYNYKDDADFKDDYAAAISDPTGFANWFNSNSQAVLNKYGIDGYNALKNLLPKQTG